MDTCTICLLSDAILVYGLVRLRVKLALGSVLDPFFRFRGLLYFIRCMSVKIKNPTSSFSNPFYVFKKKNRALGPFASALGRM
jgi:hypothetical protein